MSDIEKNDEMPERQLQYEKAEELLNSDSLQDVLQARELFKELGDYQDSESYVSRCSEKIASIRASKLLDKYSDSEHAPEHNTVAPVRTSNETIPETKPEPAAATAAAPASKSKTGLIIAAIIVVAAVFAGGLALGGFFNKDKAAIPKESTPAASDSTESETQSESEYTPIEISPEFEKADILKIEVLKAGVDEETSEDSFTATYKVTNTSSETLWTFDMQFIFLDKDGNQLCDDGRFYEGKLEPGKYTYMDAYSYDVDVNEIESVEVKSYSYKYGFNRYDIDLQNKTLNFEQEDKIWYSNVDFDKADILGLEIKDKGLDEYDTYNTEITVTNNGSDNLKEVSVDIEYYDKDGNPIYKDSRYSDSLLKPGKSVRLDTYCYDSGFIKAKDVSSFAIVGYQYYLSEKDSNGYDRYTLNFVTQTAYGENY